MAILSAAVAILEMGRDRTAAPMTPHTVWPRRVTAMMVR